MTMHGKELVQAMFVLVVGLIAVHWGLKTLKKYLNKVAHNKVPVSIVISIIYIVLMVSLIITVLVMLGFDSNNVFRLLIIFSLALIAIVVVFRPYIPTLPFKVGNTIKVGSLLGKVEATTIVNTRMRTFDGKTVFVPNSKVLNDFVINYHYFGTRRIKINFVIRNFNDLMRTKQLLEAIMIEDPRALLKPARPVVYTLNVVDGFVEVGARCWVDKSKYWVVRCDLLEKMLLRMDQEGIALAFRRRDVRVFHNPSGADPPHAGHLAVTDAADAEEEVSSL
jgi:small conductance mechanosensitive channel